MGNFSELFEHFHWGVPEHTKVKPPQAGGHDISHPTPHAEPSLPKVDTAEMTNTKLTPKASHAKSIAAAGAGVGIGASIYNTTDHIVKSAENMVPSKWSTQTWVFLGGVASLYIVSRFT